MQKSCAVIMSGCDDAVEIDKHAANKLLSDLGWLILWDLAIASAVNLWQKAAYDRSGDTHPFSASTHAGSPWNSKLRALQRKLCVPDVMEVHHPLQVHNCNRKYAFHRHLKQHGIPTVIRGLVHSFPTLYLGRSPHAPLVVQAMTKLFTGCV